MIINGREAPVFSELRVAIASASNAGFVTLATVMAQPVIIDSVLLRAVAAAPAAFTSGAITGGTADAVVFLSAAQAVAANLNAADKQVATLFGWIAELAATKVLRINLLGTGATAVDFLCVITYHSLLGGFLV